MAKKRSKATSGRPAERAYFWWVYIMVAALLPGGVAAQLLSAAASPEPAAAPVVSTVPLPAHGEAVSNAPAGGNSARTLNLYGGGMRPLVEERGGVQTLNIYGPGGQIIAQVVRGGQGAETVRYLLTDHLGSTRAVLDAEGNAVARYEYAPHGETTIAGTAAAEVQYRYTGHPYDEAQEVYETPARGYDPTLGRFLSVDPQRQDASPYVYAGNNPVGYLDSTGGGDVPFFMVSGMGPGSLYEKSMASYIANLVAGEKIQDLYASDAFNTPSKGGHSPAIESPGVYLRGRGPMKVTRNEEFFWIIGDKGVVTLPDQLMVSLKGLRAKRDIFGKKIVLLDFSSGLKAYKSIKDELDYRETPNTVVEARIVDGPKVSGYSSAKGFTVGDRSYTPAGFRRYVRDQMSIKWPNFNPPGSDAGVLGGNPSSPQTSGATETPIQSSARMAKQKRPPEFGVVSDPKRLETSIGADSLSGEVEKSGVLGDLSLPFPEVPEYIPPMPGSFFIEPK